MKTKLYHSLLMLAAFAVMGLTSCQKDFPEFDFEGNIEQITTRDQTANGAPVTYGFWGGQHIDVGSMVVSNDEDNIYVTFNTSGNWWLQVTHLHISTTLQGIPSNKKGTPVPGHFEYKNIHNPRVQTYTYSVPNTWGEGEDLVIAAHAEVVLLGENGNVIQEETAFGGDTPGPGSRWWFWGGYTVGNNGSGGTGGNEGGGSQPIIPISCEITDWVNVTTYGGTDGSATVVASDGIPPYTYLWNDPAAQTTETASGLGAGTYSVTVTDAAGEQSTCEVTISQPAEEVIVTPPGSDYAWLVDTLGSSTPGGVPSEVIDGRVFVAVSEYSNYLGHPAPELDGFKMAIADEAGNKIGTMTIFYPEEDNLKTVGAWSRTKTATNNNAEPFWYINIILADGYAINEAGFYFVTMGDDSKPSVNLPISVNFPGDYFTRKPNEGDNSYTLYLNDQNLSDIDFTYGFYVSAFVEYTDTENSINKFISQKN